MLKVSDLLSIEDLIGFKIVDNSTESDEVDAVIIKRLVERSMYNRHRIIGPMSVVTMDFRTDRVNINHDANGVIESVSPG